MRPAGGRCIFTLRLRPKPSSIEVGFFERQERSCWTPAVRCILTLRLTPSSTVEVGMRSERDGSAALPAPIKKARPLRRENRAQKS